MTSHVQLQKTVQSRLPKGETAHQRRGPRGSHSTGGSTEGPWSKAGGSGSQPEPKQEDLHPVYRCC